MTSPTPEEKLKPCPNGLGCVSDGHMAPLYNMGEGRWRVECACGWRGPLALTIPEAITAWNRRSPSRRSVLEEAARVADRWADIFPQAGNSISAAIRALAEEK